MSRLAVESASSLVEVCVNPVVDRTGLVGLIAMDRNGKGWTKLTTKEARELADTLLRAANEAEESERLAS